MSAINSIFSSHDASNSSPLKEPHDQELCKDTFCEYCIEKDHSDEDSDSDEDYSPGTQIKLVVFNHAVSANDFLAIPYPSIPVFSGNPHEITCAYLDLVESEWTEYSQLQAHWVAKLRGSYLAGEALKVADDFVGYDWLKFREHMERWFPSANARMHMRYMMVDSHSYLVDMDLRQAISRARQDYIAQGDEYDAPEPAGNLAMRIPKHVCAKYGFFMHQHSSGRAILEAIEDIVWKEKVGCGSTADWLGPAVKPTLKVAEPSHTEAVTTLTPPAIPIAFVAAQPAPRLTAKPVLALSAPAPTPSSAPAPALSAPDLSTESAPSPTTTCAHPTQGQRQVTRQRAKEMPYYDYLSKIIM